MASKHDYLIKHPTQGFVMRTDDGKITFCNEFPDAKLFTSANKAKATLKAAIPGIPGSWGLTQEEINQCEVIQDYGMDCEKVV
jgi:hypothetical protein